jgi:hypothetical protein
VADSFPAFADKALEVCKGFPEAGRMAVLNKHGVRFSGVSAHSGMTSASLLFGDKIGSDSVAISGPSRGHTAGTA